jgi:hypothetical protein
MPCRTRSWYIYTRSAAMIRSKRKQRPERGRRNCGRDQGPSESVEVTGRASLPVVAVVK